MTSDSPSSVKNLNYVFRSPDLLKQALTHRSFHNENPNQSVGHNERLEFLGDAVLDLVISEKLFSNYSHYDEGSLSKLRASLVNETVLAEISRELELGQSMKLGRGEEVTQGFEKPRLLASTLEALVGAVYLDSDFPTAQEFILQLFKDRLQPEGDVNELFADYKTRLQEKIQSRKRKTPIYEVLSETGPDHEKVFKVCVKVDAEVLGEGEGRSKKNAEQNAAKAALGALANQKFEKEGVQE